MFLTNTFFIFTNKGKFYTSKKNTVKNISELPEGNRDKTQNMKSVKIYLHMKNYKKIIKTNSDYIKLQNLL